ncbi:unnamed protein product [Gordionus sp. m RMFG-2023]
MWYHFTIDSFIPSVTGLRSLKEGSIPTIFKIPIPLQDRKYFPKTSYTLNILEDVDLEKPASHNVSKTIDTINILEDVDLEKPASHNVSKTIDTINILEDVDLEKPASHNVSKTIDTINILEDVDLEKPASYSFYRTYSFYSTCSFYSTLIAKLFLLQNLFLLQYLFILQYLDSQILMDEYQSNFDLDEEITSTRDLHRLEVSKMNSGHNHDLDYNLFMRLPKQRFKFNDMDVEQKPENPLKQVSEVEIDFNNIKNIEMPEKISPGYLKRHKDAKNMRKVMKEKQINNINIMDKENNHNFKHLIDMKDTSFPSSIKIFTNSKPLQALSENTNSTSLHSSMQTFIGCANAKKHTAGSSDKNIVIHSCNYDRQKDSFRPLLNTKRTIYSTVLYYHMEIILGH